MRLTLLDAILISVMLISASLAVGRGLVRTVLDVTCCAAACFVTTTAMFLMPNHDIIRDIEELPRALTTAAALESAIFVCALTLVVIPVGRISHKILKNRIGNLDRILGFFSGLGRGLLTVSFVFLFYFWIVPPAAQSEWVANAKSKVLLQRTSEWLLSIVPDDPQDTILRRLDQHSGPTTQAPAPKSFGFFEYTVLYLLIGLLLSPIVGIVAIVASLARPEPDRASM